MKRQLSPWSRQCKAQMILLDKSLEALSKETKFSRTYLSSIINGRMAAPDETIRIICDALEIDMPPVQ